METQEHTVTCPYCGELFTTIIDCSAGTQLYVEDCRICCQPIVFQVMVDSEGSLIDVLTEREND
jgi:transcription elongation factor Elf1